ncbi:MAG: AAA family ATPase [Dehalococcoidia bacterium]|nr:AAA family ATPase [Dehalococcoidia bacterium]MYA53275.1 AAA family ATPase [Dehalococcoidia bacterium]
MTATPFLTRVRIKGYKSITACDTKLGSLAFLVGPNGSGKSNFIDALRFVADALTDSPDRVDPDHNVIHVTPGKVPDTPLGYSLESRGGIRMVHQQMGPLGFSFAIRLDFLSPHGSAGHYSLQIGANEAAQVRQEEPQFVVEREECVFADGPSFSIDKNTVDGFPPPPFPPDTSWPCVDRTQLYLRQLALFRHESPTLAPFRKAHDAFLRMRFYTLAPEVMRKVATPAESELLRQDGVNIWDALRGLHSRSPSTFRRIEEYLGHAVPGLSIEPFVLSNGDSAYAEFQQQIPGRSRPSKHAARSMSDGTLRAVGILTALLQEDKDGPPSVVAIEEPETALHPGAVGMLLSAMQDAKERTQVLVTTHSPDLLHSDEVQTDELLAFSADSGATVVEQVDEGSRKILGDRLFSPGELLRLSQLEPSDLAHDVDCDEASLFEL